MIAVVVVVAIFAVAVNALVDALAVTIVICCCLLFLSLFEIVAIRYGPAIVAVAVAL